MFGNIQGLRFSRSTKHTVLFTGLCINVFLLFNLLAKPTLGPDYEYIGLCAVVAVIAVAGYFLAGDYADVETRWGARVLACFIPLLGAAFSLYVRFIAISA